MEEIFLNSKEIVWCNDSGIDNEYCNNMIKFSICITFANKCTVKHQNIHVMVTNRVFIKKCNTNA